MIPYIQKFRHDPENGLFGDCDRTCVACLLGVPPDRVPNWGIHYDNIDKFNEVKAAFLRTQSLHSFTMAFNTDLDKVLEMMGFVNPDVLYILGGTSTSGCGHSVIACGGEIIHDPSLNVTESGHTIVGPIEDGYYWIELFVPTLFTKGD